MLIKKIALSKGATLGSIIGALTLSLASPVFAASKECPAGLPPIEQGALEEIRFTREHSRTMQSTVSMLRRHHYEDIQIDDDFADLWLDEYLDFLDPSKSFLLQSDIDQFEQKYSRSLDDLAADGDLTAAEEIYLIYRDRAQEQIQICLLYTSDAADD